MERVPIDRLRTDGGTQPRATKHLDVIEDYAAQMVDGRWDWARPGAPLIVFNDGSSHWLADGFHRYDAAIGAELTELPCDVRQGTARDAVLHSVGANADHGLRRTNEDKRRAVQRLLEDPEWSLWSDREIAQQCRVSHEFVRRMRPEPSVNVDRCERRVERGGTTYTMDTSRIGRGRAEPADQSVFDNSAFANGKPAEAALTPTLTSDEVRRVDLGDAALHHAISAAVAALRGLPAAGQAVDRYPRALEHAIDPDELDRAAQWLADFAAAWRAGQDDRETRKTSLQRKAREVMESHVLAS